MANGNYYVGMTSADALGDAKRYLYALRRNADGELFFLRSDQMKDHGSIQINWTDAPDGNFEEFEAGVDFYEGIDKDHVVQYENLKYPQYRWDNRNILYYVDADGHLVARINQGYTYPEGISS